MHKRHTLGRALTRLVVISVGGAALAAVAIAASFLLRTSAPVVVPAPAAPLGAQKTIWVTLPASHCATALSRGIDNNPGKPGTLWLQFSGPTAFGPDCPTQAPLSHFSQPAAPSSPGGM